MGESDAGKKLKASVHPAPAPLPHGFKVGGIPFAKFARALTKPHREHPIIKAPEAVQEPPKTEPEKPGTEPKTLDTEFEPPALKPKRLDVSEPAEPKPPEAPVVTPPDEAKTELALPSPPEPVSPVSAGAVIVVGDQARPGVSPTPSEPPESADELVVEEQLVAPEREPAQGVAPRVQAAKSAGPPPLPRLKPEAPEVKACPACGKNNQPHYKFCLGCGKELPKIPEEPLAERLARAGPPAAGMKSCLSCGKENQDHYKFCLGCGIKLPVDLPATLPAADSIETAKSAEMPELGLGLAALGLPLGAPPVAKAGESASDGSPISVRLTDLRSLAVELSSAHLDESCPAPLKPELQKHLLLVGRAIQDLQNLGAGATTATGTSAELFVETGRVLDTASLSLDTYNAIRARDAPQASHPDAKAKAESRKALDSLLELRRDAFGTISQLTQLAGTRDSDLALRAKALVTDFEDELRFGINEPAQRTAALGPLFVRSHDLLPALTAEHTASLPPDLVAADLPAFSRVVERPLVPQLPVPEPGVQPTPSAPPVVAVSPVVVLGSTPPSPPPARSEPEVQAFNDSLGRAATMRGVHFPSAIEMAAAVQAYDERMGIGPETPPAPLPLPVGVARSARPSEPLSEPPHEAPLPDSTPPQAPARPPTVLTSPVHVLESSPLSADSAAVTSPALRPPQVTPPVVSPAPLAPTPAPAKPVEPIRVPVAAPGPRPTHAPAAVPTQAPTQRPSKPPSRYAGLPVNLDFLARDYAAEDSSARAAGDRVANFVDPDAQSRDELSTKARIAAKIAEALDFHTRSEKAGMLPASTPAFLRQAVDLLHPLRVPGREDDYHAALQSEAEELADYVLEDYDVSKAAALTDLLAAALFDTGNSMLISRVVGREWDDETLSDYLAMEPGERELRTRLVAAELWADQNGNWRRVADARNLTATVARMCQQIGLTARNLREPTQEEKLEALTTLPAARVLHQFVPDFFAITRSDVNAAGVPDPGTTYQPSASPADLLADFAAWYAGDASSLASSWDQRMAGRGWTEQDFGSAPTEANPGIPTVGLLGALYKERQATGLKAIGRDRKSKFTERELNLLAEVLGKPAQTLGNGDLTSKNAAMAVERAKAIFSENHGQWKHSTAQDRMRLWREGQVDAYAIAELVHRAIVPAPCPEEGRRFVASMLSVAEPDMTPKHAAGVAKILATRRTYAVGASSFASDPPTLEQLAEGAQLLEKLTDPNQTRFTPGEIVLRRRLFGIPTDSNFVGPRVVQAMAGQLRAFKTEADGSLTGVKLFAPEVLKLHKALVRSAQSTGSQLASDSMLASLRASARRYEQYQTLLDFLGVSIPVSCAPGIPQNSQMAGGTVPKSDKPVYKNQDAHSGATIMLPDGTKLSLGFVADAAGAYTGAERASSIARDVFDIAAMAGWITNAEEARAAMVMMDLAVLMLQVDSKTPILRDSPLQEMGSRMVTTGTILVVMDLPDGTRRSFGVQCGDSSYIMFNALGQAVFASIDDSYANLCMMSQNGVMISGRFGGQVPPDVIPQIESLLGLQPHSLHRNHSIKASSTNGIHWVLQSFDITADGSPLPGAPWKNITSEPVYRHKYESLVRLLFPHDGHGVIYSLGCESLKVSVNNRVVPGPKAVTLNNGNAGPAFVASDGIDPVCHHELTKAAGPLAGKKADARVATNFILGTAVSRRPVQGQDRRVQLSCGCIQHRKLDDIALVFVA